MPGITVEKLAPPAGSDIDFGAVISNVDLENITGMYTNQVMGNVEELT